MISIEEYKQNPCEALSIPYWKATDIIIPDNVKIIHNLLASFILRPCKAEH